MKMCAFAVLVAASVGYMNVPVHGHPLGMLPHVPLMPPINNVVHTAPLPATDPQRVLLQQNHFVIQHNNTLPHLTITPRPLVDPTEMFLGLGDSFRRKLGEQYERAKKGEIVITTPAPPENRESEDTEAPASDTTAAASSETQVPGAATAAVETASFDFTKVLHDLTQRTEKLRARLQGVQKVYAQSGLTGVADHLASIGSSVTIPAPPEDRESEDIEVPASDTTAAASSETQVPGAATAAVETASFDFTKVLHDLTQRTEKLRARLQGVQKVYAQSGLTGVADHLASIGSSVQASDAPPSEASPVLEMSEGSHMK